MQSLNVELKPIDATWVQLRYWLGSAPPETRQLKLSDIQPLIDRGEMYYYTTRPNLVPVGQQLFAWLDGDGRWLSGGGGGGRLQNCTPPGLVLAIDTDARLAHLPWEVLHDGQGFFSRAHGHPRRARALALVAAADGPPPRPLQVLFIGHLPRRVGHPSTDGAKMRFNRDRPHGFGVKRRAIKNRNRALRGAHPPTASMCSPDAMPTRSRPPVLLRNRNRTRTKATAAELFAFAGRCAVVF